MARGQPERHWGIKFQNCQPDTLRAKRTVGVGARPGIRPRSVLQLVPSVALAVEAGLDVDNGIRVDKYGQTSAPDVYAAGDCTSHPDAQDGGFRRLESQPNALEMAATVAASLVGNPAPYVAVPWFWSDQYNVKLQTVGLYKTGDEPVLRGDAVAVHNGRTIKADTLTAYMVKTEAAPATPGQRQPRRQDWTQYRRRCRALVTPTRRGQRNTVTVTAAT